MPPNSQKPPKSLYCRRFSRVRRIRESGLPRPLWKAAGITFGTILAAVGLLGALWALPLRLQGRQNLQKGAKNRGVESVLAPTVSKKGAQGCPRPPKWSSPGRKVALKSRKTVLPKARFTLENCGRDRVLAPVACTMSGTISAVNFTCSSRGEVHGGNHVREFHSSPALRTKTPSAAV